MGVPESSDPTSSGSVSKGLTTHRRPHLPPGHRSYTDREGASVRTPWGETNGNVRMLLDQVSDLGQ